VIPDNCNNLCFIIDSKTIERIIIKLKKDLEVLTKLGIDYVKLDGEFDGEIADWMSGVTLIRDDYFLQHSMAVAADQMVTASQAIDADQADLNSWPLKFINWDLAAEDLKKRYAPIDYNGVKYWIEKPI
jgi:hypothetical protein